MADEFLEEMRTEWRRQDSAFAEVHARLRRTRWRPHLVLALELACGFLALSVGVWFAVTAFNLGSLLFAVSAAVMLLAAPVLIVAAVLARRDSLRWEEETPASVLAVGIRRADASLRAARIGRWHMASIGAFVALLWALQGLDLIDARSFLVFYTVVCLLMAIPYLLWLAWRERRVRAERAACRRLLDVLEVES